MAAEPDAVTNALPFAYIGLILAKGMLASRSARRMSRLDTVDLSSVVIVQPILSGDPQLRHVLAANVVALPEAAFVWLIDHDDGAAQEICHSLRTAHAQTRIEILSLPQAPDGHNPKLFKLELARTVVGDRVMFVLDDDARLSVESARAVVEQLSHADIATALPACLDDGRCPSALLAQFVNNNAAMTYLPLLNVGAPVTINGMAYAMKAGTVAAMGGFSPIMHAITDDLAVAERVTACGGTIAQTAAPVFVQTTVTDVRHYMRQMHRWHLFALLLFLKQPLWLQASITVLNVLPPLLLIAIVACALTAPSTGVLIPLAATFLVRMLLLRRVQQLIYRRVLHCPLLSLCSELLQPLHLLHALVQRDITWRKRRYRVHSDGSFEARR